MKIFINVFFHDNHFTDLKSIRKYHFRHSGHFTPSFSSCLSQAEYPDILSPLSLLDREYSYNDYNDIIKISGKPVPDRSYEEQIALNFSEPMLARLLLTEKQRLDAKRNEETAAFLQNTDLLNRFGGSLNKEQIEAVQTEYETNGSSDADILFVFHALNDNSKKAFLSMTAGMLMQDCNIQRFNVEMDKAMQFTLDRLQKAITGELDD